MTAAVEAALRAAVTAPLPAPGAVDWARIAARHRPRPAAFARGEDFTLDASGPDAAFDPAAGSVYAADVIGRAWLVCDVPHAALFGAADFAYGAQFAAARRLARVPWGRLAAPGRHSPAPLHVFSIGRCGSTLLVRLAAAAGVVCASELDGFTALGRVAARLWHDAAAQDGLAALHRELEAHVCAAAPVGAAVGAAVGAPVGAAVGAPVLLKHRSQAAGLLRTFAADGQPRPAVFMVRGVSDWAASVCRHFPGAPAEHWVAMLLRCIRAAAWARRAGLPLTVLRYEALRTGPDAAMTAVLGALPGAAAPPPAALGAVMAADSQAGSALARARARPASPEDAARAARVVALWREAAPRPALAVLGLGPDLRPAAG